MNYLLAHTRNRKSSLKLVLPNEDGIYKISESLSSSIPYTAEDSIDEEYEWFFLDNFSHRKYCPEFTTLPINGTKYIPIKENEIKLISYLCSIQDGGLFCFQKVEKKQILKEKFLIFGDSFEIVENSKKIIINDIPDAIYRKEDDKLFFKKLSPIKKIFKGIDEIFREATDDEVKNFLASDFIIKAENYDFSNVKTLNRKRIALAKEVLKNYDDEQKAAIFQSIRHYYPSIVNDDNSFKIETDKDLESLLYGILQRFYTTADGRDRRIATSVRSL